MSHVQTGRDLVKALRNLVLDVMRNQPECAPSGGGMNGTELEGLCGLDLALDAQDHYLIWSVLQTLIRDGHVTSSKVGSRRLFGLSSTEAK